MKEFVIEADGIYLQQNVNGFYNCDYVGMGNVGNPDYVNILKNQFDDRREDELQEAVQKLKIALTQDLNQFDKSLTVCVVPRAKVAYSPTQLLFRDTVEEVIDSLNFSNGISYIVRVQDTQTTHLIRSGLAGEGDRPYPGITMQTCELHDEILNKDILLIDDIYTNGINIDEDMIQALFDKGANSVRFYSVGKTI